ncbi:MAG: helix-hairpin-helix domain-containing protein [Verrucomicrobiota bacterium]
MDNAPDPAGNDDLKKLTGVGPKLAEKLNAEGISSFDQIAKWSEDDFAEFNEKVSLKGIEYGDLIAEAKKLAK